MISKCNTCTHRKNCIDGVNYKYAKSCKKYHPQTKEREENETGTLGDTEYKEYHLSPKE